jgi:hypothetical protein
MEIVEIKTLIDVTNTQVSRANQGTPEEYDQYRNWTTLLQCIGLRSIIAYEGDAESEIVDIKNSGFGSAYKGKHRVWTFRFYPDRPAAFYDGNNAVGLLIEDLNSVPVMQKLTETINIDRPVFNTDQNSTYKNTIVKAIKGTF